MPNTIETLRAQITDYNGKIKKDLRVIGWERWEDGSWEPIILDGESRAHAAENLDDVKLYFKKPPVKNKKPIQPPNEA